MTAVGAMIRRADLESLLGLESLAEGHLDDPSWLQSDHLGGFLNASNSALATHGTPVELPTAAADGNDS